MESKQTPETVTWTDRFLKVAQHLPPADAFAIAAFIDELVEEEKRKEAIAFAEWVEGKGYERSAAGKWYYEDFGIDEEYTSDELYDNYEQSLSLTQNKEL